MSVVDPCVDPRTQDLINRLHAETERMWRYAEAVGSMRRRRQEMLTLLGVVLLAAGARLFTHWGTHGAVTALLTPAVLGLIIGGVAGLQTLAFRRRYERLAVALSRLNARGLACESELRRGDLSPAVRIRLQAAVDSARQARDGQLWVAERDVPA